MDAHWIPDVGVGAQAGADGHDLGSWRSGRGVRSGYFCGALLGHQFAIVTEWISSSWALPMGHAVLAGLAGMLAGVLHAPLTAILLTAEVSGGYALFVPVMLTSAISFRISKSWMKHTVYTRELAERGELLTHDKDQSILTLMNLMDQVESDHEVVNPHWTLGQLIPIIERSVMRFFRYWIGMVSFLD